MYTTSSFDIFQQRIVVGLCFSLLFLCFGGNSFQLSKNICDNTIMVCHNFHPNYLKELPDLLKPMQPHPLISFSVRNENTVQAVKRFLWFTQSCRNIPSIGVSTVSSIKQVESSAIFCFSLLVLCAFDLSLLPLFSLATLPHLDQSL